MMQKVIAPAAGFLMILVGAALMWLTSVGAIGHAAEVAGAANAAGTVPVPRVLIRIAAGRDTPYKDSQGNIWEADNGFDGGATVMRPELKVTGTTEPGLYCAERYSMDAYTFRVPNGTYNVRLHFSECFEDNKNPDDRVFTFNVQGKEFRDFSPWRRAGDHFKAYVETVNDVRVTDGQIKITFTRQVQPPQINAIEICTADADGPLTSAVAQPVPGLTAVAPVTHTAAILRMVAGRTTPFKDSQGNVWEAEKGFVGGATVERPELQVAGTTEPRLYCSEHYAMESWSCKVPNGTYVVKLHFSEGYEGVTSPEDRIFSFDVQGHKFEDFSPWKKAGGNFKAYVEIVKGVKVTDGQIKVTFTPRLENPTINAIEVYTADAP